MTDQPTPSTAKLIQDCKRLAESGKLDAFETQTVDEIEDVYLSTGGISMAEMKFLVSLLKRQGWESTQ